jgi:hypothetical protein
MYESINLDILAIDFEVSVQIDNKRDTVFINSIFISIDGGVNCVDSNG